jgi:geranylgeranyl reductase family protein
MFDCIIIGSGPAGATAAYRLAKKGKAVLVLEKASLPRIKACSGGISPAIAQWFDFDFTPVINNTVNQIRFTWNTEDPVETTLENIQPMWMVKRDEFDHFLVQQAQKAGAEVKDRTEVTEIKLQGNNWEIITPNETFSASYLIVADGVKGTIAQKLGFKPNPEYLGANLEIKASISSEKQHQAAFDFGSLKHGYIWAFPKSDGYSLSGGFFKAGKGKATDLKQQLTNYATKIGLDLSQSEYAEHPLAVWTKHRPLHTKKAILAGDGAGLADPLTGEGIRPAILTGVKGAEAIAQAIEGNESALEQYTKIIQQEWESEMGLANNLASLFFQFPKVAYNIGVKRPIAAQLMSQILCGELKYSDVTEQAMRRLKRRLIPGMK